jgi:uncharacterized membrane protein YphA (DoxX/SURF4 family)
VTPRSEKPGRVSRARRDGQASSDAIALPQLLVVKWVVVLGLASAFLIAPGLWLAHPFFGPIPVWSGPPRLGPPWDWLWLGAIVVLLVPILARRRPETPILVWCAVFAARSVWDQLTWQPYFFQYFFMLLSLAFADWSEGERDTRRNIAVLNANRLVLSSIYLWSGLAKLHVHYFVSGGVFRPYASFMALPAAVRFPLAALPALLETTLALFLLLPHLRRVGVVGLIAMHALILLAIGPFGHAYNPVVWPWNLAMVALLLVLFWGPPSSPWRAIVWGYDFAYHRVLLVLFGLCPMLSYWGLFPTYLSYRLYAQRDYAGQICLSRAVVDRLPADLRRHVSERPGCPGHIAIPYWAERALRAFPPGDPPVYRAIAARFRGLGESAEDVVLYIDDPPAAWTGSYERHRYTRDQLE